MRWEDERYVRLYTRDTVTWKRLPWQGKALLPLLLRKADRHGIVDVEGDVVDGVSALTDLPPEVVAPGVEALLDRGVVTLDGSALAFPHFRAAQEAKASDRLRAQDYRDRQKAVTHRDEASRTVTDRHDSSRAVTARHTASHGVTPSLAEPSGIPSESHEGGGGEPPPAEDPAPEGPDPASGHGDGGTPRLPTQESLTKLTHWDAREAAQGAAQGALGVVVTRDTIDRLGALLPGLADQGVTAADFASLGAAIAAGAIRRKTGAKIDWAWLVRDGRLAPLIESAREWRAKTAARTAAPTLAVVRPPEQPAPVERVCLSREEIAARMQELRAKVQGAHRG